jgi:mono/diheme cytochrome c family protein
MAVVIAGTFLAWRSGEESAPLADPEDPAQVALGENVYRLHCAACHGANLEGQPDWRSPGPDGRLPAPPHNETGHTWHHPDALLFRMTRDGMSDIIPGHESNMPGFGGVLSDEEIWAVLAYIKNQWPREALDYQQRIDRQNR